MYKRVSLIASAVVWIVLPKCSACLVAYTSLFSALGLGQVVNHPYTLTIIEGLLAVNVAASLYLAVKAKQYLYAGISFVCTLVFIINKLYLNSTTVTLIMSVVLLAAALRIRFFRVGKRECLFKNDSEAACLE